MSQDRTTPAFKVFHTYYRCRIPASYAFEAQQSLFGTPMYQNESQETQAASEMILLQLNIAAMAQYYYRGAPIELETPSESVHMYRTIREYLDHVQTKVNERVNVGKVPIEDIQKFDQFAMVLYRIARRYEQVDSRQSQMNTRLEELFGSRFQRRDKYLESESSTNNGPEPEPEHEPVSGVITQRMLERNLPPSRR